METLTPPSSSDAVLVTLPGAWEELERGWYVRQYNDGKFYIEARVFPDNPLVRFQAKVIGQYPGLLIASQMVAEELAMGSDEAAVVAAIARLELALGMRAKAIADQYSKGAMPEGVVKQMYALREAECDALSKKDVITVFDVQALERGGRFRVACDLFARCDAHARCALLHDEHHSVRSAAQISLQSL